MKRKTEKKERRIFILKTCIFFIVLACFLTVGYSILSQDLSLSAVANIANQSDGGDFNLLTDQTIINKWGSEGKYMYQYNLALGYSGDTAIASWYAKFDVPDDAHLDDVWSSYGEIVDGYLYLYNAEYEYRLENGILNPKPNFQISSSIENYDVVLVDSKVYASVNDNPNAIVVDSSLVDVNFDFTNQGQNNEGYSAQAILNMVNNSGVKIAYWELKIPVPDGTKVTNIWNCNYVIKNGYLYLYGEGSHALTVNGNINSGLQILFPEEVTDLNIESSVYKTLER